MIPWYHRRCTTSSGRGILVECRGFPCREVNEAKGSCVAREPCVAFGDPTEGDKMKPLHQEHLFSNRVSTASWRGYLRISTL